MNYLEVKFEKNKEKEVDVTNFISNVIDAQSSLGLKKEENNLNHEKLLEIGFIYNSSTKGYGIQKDFNLTELIKIARAVDLLDNHILTHGYIELKIHQGELYFWDKALIYEGIDTFEYCLEHHNTFNISGLNVVTKSDSINETLLNIIDYTKRFTLPNLEFITQSCVWDGKLGYKVLKEFVEDINEYIPRSEFKSF